MFMVWGVASRVVMCFNVYMEIRATATAEAVVSDFDNTRFVMAKANKTADASTAKAASKKQVPSFPHPFGSQEGKRIGHIVQLVIKHYRSQGEAFTDKSARKALQHIAQLMLASGKSQVYAIMSAAQLIEKPLEQIEMLHIEMKGFTEDWPSNMAEVKAFIEANKETIEELDGKTKFSSLK